MKFKRGDLIKTVRDINEIIYEMDLDKASVIHVQIAKGTVGEIQEAWSHSAYSQCYVIWWPTREFFAISSEDRIEKI